MGGGLGPAEQLCEHHFQIPGHPDRGGDIFIEFRMVDIHMDDLGVRGKAGSAPRHPVGKPGAAHNSTSHSRAARLAARVPCIPTMPSHRRCRGGKPPSPIMEAHTGISSFSASASSSRFRAGGQHAAAKIDQRLPAGIQLLRRQPEALLLGGGTGRIPAAG